MNNHDPSVERVLPLIEAACLGTISNRQKADLQDLLRGDAELQRVYLEYCRMHSELRCLCRASATNHAVMERIAAETESGSIEHKIYVDRERPTASFPALVFGLLGGACQGTCGYLAEHHMVFSYMVAVVFLSVAALVGSLVYVSPGEHPGLIVSGDSAPNLLPEIQSVGHITGMKNCRWSASGVAPMVGSYVPLGRKYSLESGLLQITYITGANVILEGPCEYRVNSNVGGHLALGKLTARVEKAKTQAANPESRKSSLIPHPSSLFSVTTPTATVTDLGTEFGVEVNKDGGTTSHVFQGSVKVRAAAGGRLDEIVLRVDESARVFKKKNVAGSNLVRVDATETLPKFVRQLTAPPDTKAEDAYMRAVLADRPLGYWPLNEPPRSRKFLDRSGNGFHGTALGEVLPGQSGPLSGQSRSVALDGRGYIDVGRNDRFAMANGFTVEAWAWIEGATQRSGRIISAASCDGRHQRSGWGFGALTPPSPESDDPQPYYYYFTSYDVASQWSFEAQTAQWGHLAYVFDSDNSGRLYVNGELRATYPAGQAAKVGPSWVAIGWGANENGEYWRGRLAHVAVYHAVLSLGQIRNHYRCSEAQATGGTEVIQHDQPNTLPNRKETQSMQQ